MILGHNCMRMYAVIAGQLRISTPSRLLPAAALLGGLVGFLLLAAYLLFALCPQSGQQMLHQLLWSFAFASSPVQ